MAASEANTGRLRNQGELRDLPIDFFDAEVIKNRYDPDVAKRGLEDADDEDDNDADD